MSWKLQTIVPVALSAARRMHVSPTTASGTSELLLRKRVICSAAVPRRRSGRPKHEGL